MERHIRLVLKSKLQRDYILPIYDVNSIIMDNKAYFYGGIVDNNISKILFYYDIDSKEIIRIPDAGTKGSVVTLLKENDTVGFIDSYGDLYNLINNKWVFIKTLNLSNRLQVVITDRSQYIIDDGRVYEYVNGEIVLLYESELISAIDYIPSIDKDIIYFERCTLNLKNSVITEVSNSPDYIIYGKKMFKSDSDSIVIDKGNSYLLSYNNPLTNIKKKTVSSTDWYNDEISSRSLSLNPVQEILPCGSVFYFSEISNSKHNVYKVDLKNSSVDTHISISRNNKSYSKNVMYNHSFPKMVKYKDSVALMGHGGFYYDNNIHDNSIYLSSKPVTELPLNVQTPLYYKEENSVMIMDTSKCIIYQYSYSGQLFDVIKIPNEKDIKRFLVSDDDIIINTDNSTYVYNKSLDRITKEVNHANCIASAMSKYFAYYIIEKYDTLLLVKESLSNNTKSSYKLLSNRFDYSRIDLYSDEKYVLLYIEDDQYQWEIYRIITNE